MINVSINAFSHLSYYFDYEAMVEVDGDRFVVELKSYYDIDTIKASINNKYSILFYKNLTMNKLDDIAKLIITNDVFVKETEKSIESVFKASNREDDPVESFHKVDVQFNDFEFKDGIVNISYSDELSSETVQIPVRMFFNETVYGSFNHVIGYMSETSEHDNVYFSEMAYESFEKIFNEIRRSDDFHRQLAMSLNRSVNPENVDRTWKLLSIRK